ncbi:hypothetical protein ACVLV4_001269 [Rathayibacter agropyri]
MKVVFLIYSQERKGVRYCSVVWRLTLGPNRKARKPRSRKRRAGVALTVAAAVASIGVSGLGVAFASNAQSPSLLSPPPSLPETAIPPELAPPATPPLPPGTSVLLPRDDGSGTPVYDRLSDPTSIVYPATFSSDEVANAKTWVQQNIIIGQCMADKGFDYTFKLWWQLTDAIRKAPAPYPVDSPGGIALWGEPQASGYDWKMAGCAGYATHVTGMDNSN